MKKSEIKCEVINGREYCYVALGRHVVRAIGVCGGEPVFKYTRIDILRVLGRLAAGETVDQLIEDYEGRITKEGIIEAAKIVEKIMLKALPPLPKLHDHSETQPETKTQAIEPKVASKRKPRGVAA
jgi:uncharacterized protein (DUF433 family)